MFGSYKAADDQTETVNFNLESGAVWMLRKLRLQPGEQVNGGDLVGYLETAKTCADGRTALLVKFPSMCIDTRISFGENCTF